MKTLFQRELETAAKAAWEGFRLHVTLTSASEQAFVEAAFNVGFLEGADWWSRCGQLADGDAELQRRVECLAS